MAPAGIYIPKRSSAAAAALDDSGLKGPGKNLLAVMKEGRPPRRHCPGVVVVGTAMGSGGQRRPGTHPRLRRQLQEN